MSYLILIISLVGIVFGAEFLVAGSVSVARRYKVSDFVIGAAIVGIGTSMPELVVSFVGALKGNADVAIGNVVGSNIFNVLGILGLTAICFPIAIDRKNMTFEVPFCIGVSVLLTLLSLNFFNGTPSMISRIDGLILILLFVGYMYYSFVRDRNEPTPDPSLKGRENDEEIQCILPVWKAIVKIVGGLALLITSCDFFVDNAIVIAKSWGVSDAIISLTLIACGTSLPELAASVAAACKKNTQLALGNIVGSNIFNILLILGVSSQVMPLVSADITIVDYAVMIAAAAFPLLFGFKGKIGRVGGAVMLLCFVLYTWYLIAG